MATDNPSHCFSFTDFCKSDFAASVMDWKFPLVVILANLSTYLILIITVVAISMSLVT